MPGVRLSVTDRNAYRPVEAAVRLIEVVHDLHPAEFAWTATMDRLAGTAALRSAVEAGKVNDLLARWAAEAEEFRQLRRAYLLYR